eukprot:scaffold1407_cov250-Prasinococcus_capsulatus_cf.AAC.3
MELDEPPSPGLPGQGMPPPITQEDMTASRQMLQEFLRKHTAYELLPESGRVTVLDIDLPVQHAFYALFQQDIHVAPIWDNGSSEFVGMVHPGDFVRILYDLQRGMHNQALSEAEVESHTLRKWRSRDEANGNAPRPFAYVGPDSSLQQAGLLMLKQNLEELPILASDHDPEDKCLLHMARTYSIGLAGLGATARGAKRGLVATGQEADGQATENLADRFAVDSCFGDSYGRTPTGRPHCRCARSGGGDLLAGGHHVAGTGPALLEVVTLSRHVWQCGTPCDAVCWCVAPRVQLEELTVRDALAYGGWVSSDPYCRMTTVCIMPDRSWAPYLWRRMLRRRSPGTRTLPIQAAVRQ